ncbi:unnamed protein product [Brassicogethes aeneus]|uniref:Cytochrome P450 n=1 Tax=Brassicogethes aeneus TaxID=1431903 RepID=A0A9P0B056_BRAAE|nr:unnamed protein product [Brassicogethes aeneus]
MFYYLGFLVFFLAYIYWKISRRHVERLASKIPGIPDLPIIGSTLEILNVGYSTTPTDTFKKAYDYLTKYGRVIKLWLGPKLVVFLTDPSDVEVILSSKVHIDKTPEYGFFKPWLGDGLLISTGEKWRAHRKLIAPTFHLNVLKGFMDVFNVNSRDVVEKLNKEVGREFDVHDYMSEITVEILLETAMGVSKQNQDQNAFDYATAVMKMCNILHLRTLKLWLRSDFIFNLSKYAKSQKKLLNTIHSLTRKVIKHKKVDYNNGIRGEVPEIVEKDQTKQTVDGLSHGLRDDLDDDDDIGEKKRMAFLDFMIDASQNQVVISDEEIKEQVDTIMFEGHDTTAAASSFFLSLMGIHQDIQDKVFQELDNIFGDSDRKCTFADTLELKYMERCIMETLRLYPPVPLIGRQINEDVKLASGDYTIPKGTSVGIGLFKLHRLEEFFPEPDKFNPDNFLPEKCANRHYYAFIPFSAGPRSCVGRKYAMLKLKVLLSTILRNFRMQSNVEEKDFVLQGDIILKRKDGFRITVETRK